MSITKILIISTLIIIVVAEFSCSVLAQEHTGDKIVVTGKYTLRQSDIRRLTEIYEWIFDARFTDAQRKRFETLTVEEAREHERNAKNIVSMLESFQKIQAESAEKRAEFRMKLVPEIVSFLENESNETHNLLLEVYRSAQNDAPNKNPAKDDSPAQSSSNRGGAVKTADLAGIWSTSSISGERYRSLVTGELSDPSGSIIEYKISPNGEIKHVGYLSSTIYSCTTKLFISRSGRVSINGSNITFDFAPGKRMYQTCSASASRNDTLPAERKTYPFRLERDEYGTLQLCTVENGKDFCIGKKGD